MRKQQGWDTDIRLHTGSAWHCLSSAYIWTSLQAHDTAVHRKRFATIWHVRSRSRANFCNGWNNATYKRRQFLARWKVCCSHGWQQALSSFGARVTRWLQHCQSCLASGWVWWERLHWTQLRSLQHDDTMAWKAIEWAEDMHIESGWAVAGCTPGNKWEWPQLVMVAVGCDAFEPRGKTHHLVYDIDHWTFKQCKTVLSNIVKPTVMDGGALDNEILLAIVVPGHVSVTLLHLIPNQHPVEDLDFQGG